MERTGYINCFSDANTKRLLPHFITPAFHEEKLDVIVFHTASDDMSSSKNVIQINVIVNRIICIGMKHKQCGVKGFLFSSIFLKL